MFKAVIFDFDGVITDSEILHFRAFNELLEPYGIQFSTQEYYSKYLGLTDRDLLVTLVSKGLLKADEKEIEQLVEKKKPIYENLAKGEGRIFGGVKDFLDRLKASKIPMAICSGALLCEIEFILDEAGLRDYFEAVVAADHVHKGKPDPEGFLMALDKLNSKLRPHILPRNCVVIEDSHWGLEAGKAAGMHTVGITNSYSADQIDMAEMVVAHLDDLDVDSLAKLCN